VLAARGQTTYYQFSDLMAHAQMASHGAISIQDDERTTTRTRKRGSVPFVLGGVDVLRSAGVGLLYSAS
jgi:hypothetical protein